MYGFGNETKIPLAMFAYPHMFQGQMLRPNMGQPIMPQTQQNMPQQMSSPSGYGSPRLSQLAFPLHESYR